MWSVERKMVIMDIDPKRVPLKDFFNGRLYEIPNYQRLYRWGKKQRQDLFNDIDKSMDKKKPHFMATVVGLNTGSKKTINAIEYPVVEIVDGQQRITTLVILYKAIAKALSLEPHIQTSLENVKSSKPDIGRTIDQMLVKSNGITTILLQSNSSTQGHLTNYLMNNTYESAKSAETTPEKVLFEAIIDCEQFVNKYREKKSLEDLVIHLNNRISLIYQEIDEPSYVYSMFEILNSRGLAVSSFDKLKPILMSIIYEKFEEDKSILDSVNSDWAKIYQRLGVSPLEQEILTFTATLYDGGNKILTEEESVACLKKYCDEEPNKVQEITRLLGNVARIVVEIKNSRNFVATNIKPIRLVVLAIKLHDKFSEDVKEEMCNRCYKLGFGFFALSDVRSNTSQKQFVHLARDIFKNTVTEKTTKDGLIKIAKDLSERHSIHDKCRDLPNDDYTFYLDDNQLRYLLYKYEEYLANKMGKPLDNRTLDQIWTETSSKTIEHISPQKHGKNYVNYLGNLCLLPSRVNSSLGDLPPKEKADRYDTTGLYMTNEIKNLLSNWTKKTVSERGEKIARWAIKEWGYIDDINLK